MAPRARNSKKASPATSTLGSKLSARARATVDFPAPGGPVTTTREAMDGLSPNSAAHAVLPQLRPSACSYQEVRPDARNRTATDQLRSERLLTPKNRTAPITPRLSFISQVPDPGCAWAGGLARLEWAESHRHRSRTPPGSRRSRREATRNPPPGSAGQQRRPARWRCPAADAHRRPWYRGGRRDRHRPTPN